MIYEELKPITKSEFDATMATGSSDEKRLAALRAAETIEDYSWLLDRFKLVFKTETDPNILSAAILGVGYIARLFRQADERELKKMLRPFANTATPIAEVRDAQSDIYVFLSKQRRQRKRERRKALQAQR